MVFTHKISRTFLVPQVKIALKLLKKNNYRYIKDICSDLKKHKTSFYELPTESGSAMVFKSKKLGLVFKINGTFSAPGTDYESPLPKKAIPTAIIKIKKNWVRIQPLADIKSKEIIRKEYEECWSDTETFGLDIKEENLGIWNKKVVTLDW